MQIHGKEYIEVKDRIKEFRTNPNYKGWSLVSEIHTLSDEYCCIIARAYDSDKNLIAVGTAYEKKGDSHINKTSHVENCETSAWGRCLGNLGIGIDGSISSADEVKSSVSAKPDESKVLEKQIRDLLKGHKESKFYIDMLKEKRQSGELNVKILKTTILELQKDV